MTHPIILSLELATITSVCLLPIGCSLALWITYTPHQRLASLVETLATLPLVLPPSVLGFYLLILMGNQGPLSVITQALGGQTLAFTFTGLVIGSIIYSLPFALQPICRALKQLGPQPLALSATLGLPPVACLFRVILPCIHKSLITAFSLCFAHTMGEFGVILMIGGNIPGSTRVASIAIYDAVEQMNYPEAHQEALILLGISLVLLLVLQNIDPSSPKKTHSHED